MAAIAQVFVSHGYAALAYTARGHGTSTGSVELAGPSEISDEIAMGDFFRGAARGERHQHRRLGHLLRRRPDAGTASAKGIDYKAAEVVETWTDLYTRALAAGRREVGDRARLREGGRGALAADRLERGRRDALDRTMRRDQGARRAALRRCTRHLRRSRRPTYMFQGRVDYAFDVTQAVNGYARLNAPKHLYVGQFGHAPSTFPGPDFALRDVAGRRVVRPLPAGRAERDRQVEARDDRRREAARSARRSPALPKTKVVAAGFRGTALRRTGAEVRPGARDVRRRRSSRCRCRRSRTTRGSSRRCSPATA